MLAPSDWANCSQGKSHAFQFPSGWRLPGNLFKPTKSQSPNEILYHFFAGDYNLLIPLDFPTPHTDPDEVLSRSFAIFQPLNRSTA